MVVYGNIFGALFCAQAEVEMMRPTESTVIFRTHNIVVAISLRFSTAFTLTQLKDL